MGSNVTGSRWTIIWPASIAPYSVVITPIKYDGEVRQVTDRLADELEGHGIDVLIIRRHGTGDTPGKPLMPAASTAIARDDRLLLFGPKEHLEPFRRL